jgi:hypothetical protein
MHQSLKKQREKYERIKDKRILKNHGPEVYKIRGREDGHKEMPLIVRTQGQKDQRTRIHGPKRPEVDDQEGKGLED